MSRFEQIPSALFHYGCHRFILNQFGGTFREGAAPRESSGFSMASTLRNRDKQADLPDALNKSDNRRLPLRVLFVHGHATDVERCWQELRRAHYKVTADVVLTPEQFVRSLRSKYYDVVLAEYPAANWQGPKALEILRPMDRHIPCIFLTKKMRLETVAELITEGAADCVAIDHVGHLPIAIRRALRENDLRKERDQTEKKLRHSQARYRALVGNLTYGMCRCNIKGKLLDVNQALVTMLGYASREELLAVNLANDILCDSSKRAQLLGPPPIRRTQIPWKLNGNARMARSSKFGSAGARSTMKEKWKVTKSSSKTSPSNGSSRTTCVNRRPRTR